MSLFQRGNFTLHSGAQSDWKIDCDALTDADLETLAAVIAAEVRFSEVYGIPTGGERIAAALRPYAQPNDPEKPARTLPLLIVDDVLTTGASFREAAEKFQYQPAIGVVLFARGEPPGWVLPVFRLWGQS